MSAADAVENPYESARLVAEYLAFHYGADETASVPLPENARDFPCRVVTALRDPGRPTARALDVGCAVGRSSFELARHVPDVVGVDFSQAFVNAAETLRREGRIVTSVAVEGDLREEFVASIPLGLDAERVRFEQGDAMNLRSDFSGFDIVLAANLICRLPEPRHFLARLPDLVAPGGQLLLATPFSWLREYTPEENWLGGRAGGGRGWSALQQLLEPHFSLDFQTDLPFLIREHSRKYQYGISLGSRWIRR